MMRSIINGGTSMVRAALVICDGANRVCQSRQGNFLIARANVIRSPKFATLSAVLAVVVALAGVIIEQSPAYAQCLRTPESGVWVNTEPVSDMYGGDFTKVVVYKSCFDQSATPLSDDDAPYPPDHVQTAPYSLQVFTKCSSAGDICSWDMIGAEPVVRDDGTWITGVYYYRTATYYVWVKPYSEDGQERLRVWVWRDYTNPIWNDIASDYQLVRER